MKRFLIGLALCFMPVFSFALPICEPSKTSFSCSVDTDTGDRKACSFYQYDKGGQTTFDCELPDKYKDEKGRACFKNDELSPCEKVQEENQNSDEKKPKNKKPPEGGKKPKHDSGICYQAGSEVARTVDELCAKLPQNMKHDGHMVCRINGDGAGIAISRVPCEGNLKEEHKQPKTNPNDKEKDNPNNGKQPKGNDKGEGSGDGSGKGSKGEGEGSGEGNGNGKGEGSGDGNGKGEGSGEGGGKGDAEGKGMFKGGAGSGNISEVRVPKSRDGLGWRGDFFLRNPNQCPQDKTMSILGRQVVFSYAKICQYLDMLAPVVKAVFMFVAGLMVVKSIRAK